MDRPQSVSSVRLRNGGIVDRKRIWIINHYANHPSLPGGTRHYELARRWVADGFDVTILCSSFHHKLHASARDFRGACFIEETDGVRFVWLRSRFRYSSNGLRRILSMVEFAVRAWWVGRTCVAARIPKPDAIIGSSPHPLAPVAAWRLAKRFGTPFLLEIRDLWPETLVQMGVLSRRHPIARALLRLEKTLYGRAASVISLLPGIRAYLDGIGMGQVPVVVVPNGVDTQAFRCRHETPTHEGAVLRVVYAGAHGPANGLDTVLNAAQRLRDDRQIQFLLYGDGARKTALMQQARERHLENLEFRDAVPKIDMPEVLCSADILLLNYAKIGIGEYGISPNKLWEYMSCGKPIIFAHEAVNNPVASTECGVTVPPERPDLLADAVVSLAALPANKRREMGQRGRAYALQHHDWDILAIRMAEAIEAVISGAS